jgi:hypothetical protein
MMLNLESKHEARKIYMFVENTRYSWLNFTLTAIRNKKEGNKVLLPGEIAAAGQLQPAPCPKHSLH